MTIVQRPPIRFTDKAREMVLAFLNEEADHEYYALRVAVESKNPFAPRCSVALVEAEYVNGTDHVFEADGFRVTVDPESAKLLEGGQVDWVEIPGKRGFEVQSEHLRPVGSLPLEGPFAERVKMVIERDINPFAATHGGTIRLVEVRRNTVYIQMSGRCQGCGLAGVTLREGVERMLRQAVPEIESIVDMTDHGAGLNPYY